VDDIVFDSKKESRRYSELRLLERAGMITELELQPRFDIIVNGVNCGYYKADFRYMEEGEQIIVDVKGVRLPLYKLKKKIVEAIYSIEITEV
jgi:hypothetical protein